MKNDITTNTVRFATFIQDIHGSLLNAIQKSAEQDEEKIQIVYEHLNGTEIVFNYNKDLDVYTVHVTIADVVYMDICEDVRELRATIQNLNNGLNVGDSQ